MERKKPFPVGRALEGKNVVQVSCGGMHTVALTDKGKVRVCVCEGVMAQECGDVCVKRFSSQGRYTVEYVLSAQGRGPFMHCKRRGYCLLTECSIHPPP